MAAFLATQDKGRQLHMVNIRFTIPKKLKSGSETEYVPKDPSEWSVE